MIAVNTPLFPPGRVVATPGAIDALAAAGVSVWALVSRHIAGDFGDVEDDDRRANQAAVRAGERILSSYMLPTRETVWVVTEADRSSTCCLLPADY
jgi:hypothetical protein